ncbi:MAG: alpha/beta hydrolase [Bauldia sp.]|nr:alpha/beta hydrolase [Bauldia sp.]
MAADLVSIPVGEDTVSGLWLRPEGARAVCVVAHGAGGGMRQRFLEAAARGMAERGLASLRYQFPYMEAGKARPDTPKVATAAVRDAVAFAATLAPGVPLFAGGKSFGGRMTSTAESEAHLDGVRGLFFLGFPLHPPGKPSDGRGLHLAAVGIPMLFLSGTKDDFATLPLLEPQVARLGANTTLRLFADADHSFHVPKASGTTDADTLDAVLDALAGWIDAVLAGPGGSRPTGGAKRRRSE